MRCRTTRCVDRLWCQHHTQEKEASRPGFENWECAIRHPLTAANHVLASSPTPRETAHLPQGCQDRLQCKHRPRRERYRRPVRKLGACDWSARLVSPAVAKGAQRPCPSRVFSPAAVPTQMQTKLAPKPDAENLECAIRHRLTAADQLLASSPTTRETAHLPQG